MYWACVTKDSNDTDFLHTAVNKTWEENLYANIKFSCDILLPIIFLFGVVGNVLNIVTFSRSRYRHTLDDIEKSATAGLIALAVSDLMFCLIGFPAPIIELGRTSKYSAVKFFATYYKTYNPPLMNVFLFSSTWLIVAISIERYIAVVYPFQARWFIQLKRTIIIDVMIYVFSIVFNLPDFMKYNIQYMKCPNNRTILVPHMSWLYKQHRFREAYKIAWSVVGAFIPLVVLTLCNIRLLVEVYRSRARYATDRHRYTTSKVTIILIAIILMYLLLVCPSMLLGFFTSLLPTPGAYFSYQIAVAVFNVTQGINFAMNFILYCAVSKPFRDNLCVNLCRQDTSNTLLPNSVDNRYQLVDVTAETRCSGRKA